MAKITKYLETIFDGKDLTFDEAKSLLDTVFEGDVAEVQIAAFLAAMRLKRATSDEIAGLAQSLRDHAVKVKVNIENLVDTCGTGGANIKTFNVSTASAFVAAGAGVHIAKHGNRGITSKSGSADVLAELGIKIDCEPGKIAECIEKAYIGFMYAPMFHPAMKFVQPIRKSLDFRTAFNILGPLANPAGAKYQVLGVAEESLMERIAQALLRLGTKRAMIVHSDGLDEISTIGPTKILELKDGQINKFDFNPSIYGIPLAKYADLQGDDAPTNARIITAVINGDNGPCRDIVVLNAAAAIFVSGLASDFETAIIMAKDSIDEGNAAKCLKNLIEVSNS
ncbi:MAG: anthranilate phosphoribosyltransferase [Phycisphaerae bacterium]|nr:anthranilate phosphoribosyltransferase [Phycisphaerae bacterium]